MRKEFSPSYGKWFLTDVVHAIENYALIERFEKVCVALSGGRDSTTLLSVLWLLRAYSHLRFDLCALHVRTGDYDTATLGALCSELGVEYLETRLETGLHESAGNPCYLCARLRRGAMAKALSGTGIRKVAYGHHADDAAETLFMNIVLNRKLGSFCPRVEIADADLVIIRPMIYLDAKLIARVHDHLLLPVLDHRCPYETANPRNLFRQGLRDMDTLFQTRGFARSVVASLENVDFTNLWQGKPDTEIG